MVHWSGSLAHESFLSVLLVVEHRAMCMAVQQISKSFPRHIHHHLFKVFWLCWRHRETERQTDRDRERQRQRQREMHTEKESQRNVWLGAAEIGNNPELRQILEHHFPRKVVLVNDHAATVLLLVLGKYKLYFLCLIQTLGLGTEVGYFEGGLGILWLRMDSIYCLMTFCIKQRIQLAKRKVMSFSAGKCMRYLTSASTPPPTTLALSQRKVSWTVLHRCIHVQNIVNHSVSQVSQLVYKWYNWAPLMHFHQQARHKY